MIDILIVDDDIICSTILVDYCSILKSKVSVAYNANDARKLLEANQYDYAFIDLYIEECNGLKLVRRCMNQEHLKNCKFYMVTSEKNMNLGEDTDRIEVLSKPVNRDALLTVVQQKTR